MKMPVKPFCRFPFVSGRTATCSVPALAAVFTAVLSIPAGAIQFRPVPSLPLLPPSITFPAERTVLKADLDSLAQRRQVLQRDRAAYNRECAPRLASSSSMRRYCSFRLQEVRRESSSLRVDINALRARFQAVEADALRRRHNFSVNRPGPTVNRSGKDKTDARVKYIRDALARETGGWQPVLAHVGRMAGRGAGNPALRDAAAYLRGMYDGRIAAEYFDNGYYKHGVRRWLVRDNWSAALSFARAARDNPDDHRVFASFADAAGRQHADPACTKSRRCVSGDIAGWAKGFGDRHVRAIRKLLAAAQRQSGAGRLAELRNLMGAIAIYAAKTAKDAAAGPLPDDLLASTLVRARNGQSAAAFEGYIRIWQYEATKAIPTAQSGSESDRKPGRDRAQMFFARYAAASGFREARKFVGEPSVAVGERASEDGYLHRIRAAFRAESPGNPFSGALTQAQIIRLQR